MNLTLRRRLDDGRPDHPLTAGLIHGGFHWSGMTLLDASKTLFEAL